MRDWLDKDDDEREERRDLGREFPADKPFHTCADCLRIIATNDDHHWLCPSKEDDDAE